MTRGKTGATGHRGDKGEKGDNGSDANVFIRVTNTDIYQRICNIEKKLDEFNSANEQAHLLIQEKIDIAVKNGEIEVGKAKTEHEKIRGNIGALKATVAGVSTLVGATLVWIVTHVMK